MSISIVIPTYNSQEQLKVSLRSAFKQSLPAQEIIVVNDASTDKTLEYLLSLQKEHPELKVHSNKNNMGIGYSRAKCVELASKEYINFISADDALERKSNEINLKYSKKYPDSILYSDYFRCDENLIPGAIYRAPSFPNQNVLREYCVKEARRHNMFVCYNLFGPSKIWKKCNFDPNKRMVEDLEHLLRALLIHKVKFNHVPFPLFRYRIHKGSTTSKKYWECIRENRRTFEKINKLVGKRLLWDEIFKGKKL